MKVSAVCRYTRLSPLKARPLARTLRGLRVAEALKRVQFAHSKGGLLIEKTLKSAVANVENNAKLSADEFWVSAVLIEQGPTLKRFWSRSRGMARPVLKRMAHIRVVLVNSREDDAQA